MLKNLKKIDELRGNTQKSLRKPYRIKPFTDKKEKKGDAIYRVS